MDLAVRLRTRAPDQAIRTLIEILETSRTRAQETARTSTGPVAQIAGLLEPVEGDGIRQHPRTPSPHFSNEARGQHIPEVEAINEDVSLRKTTLARPARGSASTEQHAAKFDTRSSARPDVPVRPVQWVALHVTTVTDDARHDRDRRQTMSVTRPLGLERRP